MPTNLPGDNVAPNPNPPLPASTREPLRPSPWGYDPARLLAYIITMLDEGGPAAAERARAWAQARLDELRASGTPIVTGSSSTSALRPPPGV